MTGCLSSGCERVRETTWVIKHKKQTNKRWTERSENVIMYKHRSSTTLHLFTWFNGGGMKEKISQTPGSHTQWKACVVCPCVFRADVAWIDWWALFLMLLSFQFVFVCGKKINQKCWLVFWDSWMLVKRWMNAGHWWVMLVKILRNFHKKH